jgi:O-antigen ligase
MTTAAWPPPSDRGTISALLRDARRRDPLGDRIHFVLTLVYMVMIPLATAPKDIAAAFVVFVALVRFRHTWRVYTCLLRDTVGWLTLSWAAFTALSVLWSSDTGEGLEELRAFRYIVTVFALWPVMDRLPGLIGAFIVGVFGQNAWQLLQLLEWFGFEPGVNNRLRGGLHPIHTGSMCAAALFWCLPAIFRTRGWAQWGFVGAVLVAGTGLVLSGSRGPWLATAITAVIAVLVGWIHRPAWRRQLLLAMIAALLASLIAWPFINGFVTNRVQQAMNDLGAVTSGEWSESTDVRVASWIMAAETVAEFPLFGVGAGGLREAASASSFPNLLDDVSHAHSMYMHILATNGILGMLIVGALIVLAVRRAFRDSPDHLFSEGTALVLLSWLIAAMFDAYHLAGQMFALFAFLLVAVIPFRPPVSPSPPIDPKDPLS